MSSRSQATDQNTGLVGQPIHFTSGQFAGQTVRTQLKEIQKADLGRKYARVDRRPLDPPPVVLLSFFRVYHPGTDQEAEREIANYDAVQCLGLVCTVDLFPIHNQDGGSNSNASSSRREPGPSRKQSSGSSGPTSHSTSIPQYPLQQPLTFVPAIPYDSTAAHDPSASVAITSSTLPRPSSRRVTTIAVSPLPQPQKSTQSSHHHSSSSSSTQSDVVWKVGNHAVTEGSKMTHALVGATFVQPASVDYQGRKSLMFVFADLAVKIEGTFILRYRIFDIFSKAHNVPDLVIQAECYGGTFRVYSTKEFPGLQASTELTKQLARWGVRLNIRETERKRRKKGERRSASPLSPARPNRSTRRKYELSGSEEESDDE